MNFESLNRWWNGSTKQNMRAIAMKPVAFHMSWTDSQSTDVDSDVDAQTDHHLMIMNNFVIIKIKLMRFTAANALTFIETQGGSHRFAL